MIELRHLGHLLVACECENLTRAADELGIAPSTLSASLKALRSEVGVSLFKRPGSGLYPRRSARWLFRASLPILLLERHIRRRVHIPADVEPVTLNVFLDIKFTIGQISKALLRAIAQMEVEAPHILVHPIWVDDDPTPLDGGWPEELGVAPCGSVTLRMLVPGAEPTADETLLMRDPWVLASRIAGDEAVAPDLLRRNILVTAASHGMIEAIEGHLSPAELKQIRLIAEHPASLPRLLNEQPESAFLLPSSAISGRLGLMNVTTQPYPPITTTLVAQSDGQSPVARRFIERLREALAEPEQTTVFTPELTSRRVRYFNLAHRLRSVSAAARAANVAQPALSEQLRKLEETLGVRLVDRKSKGVSPTGATSWFGAASAALERNLQDLSVGTMSMLSSDEQRLSLGVLPSVSQHGLLINRISEAVMALRLEQPNSRILIQEAPNGILQDWVLRGRVGLAIVETGPPHLPRLSLNASEELAVIVHSRHRLLPPGPVPFQELARVPLALPTSQFGLRQLVDAAARGQRTTLKPVMEVDALAMLIAMLNHGPLGTILPPSAVRRELESCELSAHPICNPSVARRLFVIYSGDRSLTPIEREFINLLRLGLGTRDGDPEVELAAVPERESRPGTLALH
jgi:LysR family nitrogen assimilation transcriptional regulator